jgi:mycothiol synthase
LQEDFTKSHHFVNTPDEVLSRLTPGRPLAALPVVAPSPPMGDQIPYPTGTRRYEPDDAPAILAIALEAVATGELEGVTRHDLEVAHARLAHDPPMCAVALEDGEIVGYVVPRHDELLVRRSARRRGHGTRLLQPARAIARRQGLPWLRAWVPTDPTSAGRRFAETVGAEYHSSQWLMRLAAGRPVPGPAFADDLVVRWMEPGTDDERFVDAANESFADHPSPIRFSVSELRSVHSRPEFDPRTVLVVAEAAAPERLIGFSRVDRYEDDDGRPVGEVRILGVRPEARGRGIGRGLLRWSIAELRARGAGDVVLTVEGANDRALGLYERTGFVAAVEWPHWTLRLD